MSNNIVMDVGCKLISKSYQSINPNRAGARQRENGQRGSHEALSYKRRAGLRRRKVMSMVQEYRNWKVQGEDIKAMKGKTG